MLLILALILIVLFFPLGFAIHALWLILLVALALGVAHALTRRGG